MKTLPEFVNPGAFNMLLEEAKHLGKALALLAEGL